MLFNFGLKSSFLLLFFLHGVVFFFLLFVKGLNSKNAAYFWLTAFTLLCSLNIAPFMLGYAGWYSKQPYRDILFYIPFQQLFLIPPVIYLYYQSLFDKTFQFSRSQLLHFLPAFLYLIYSIVVFVTDKLVLRYNYFYADGRDKDFSAWYQIAGCLSLTIYVLLSIKKYYRYKYITYHTKSNADEVMFKWAKHFLVAFMLLLTIRILFFLLNPDWGEFGNKFWYYLSFSILFYYISLSGFVNTVTSKTSFRDLADNHLMVLQIDEEKITHKLSNAAVSEDLPTENKKEVTKDLDLWRTQIEQSMINDKLFENPELTVSDLSSILQTHPKKISQMINQGFEMNFNDYVNQHRVKAVISKIENGEHNIQTLLSLAFECGFNSKSTFNRAFKRYTSVAPKEYIEQTSKK